VGKGAAGSAPSFGANTHYGMFTAASNQYVSITDGAQTGLDLGATFTIEWWMRIQSQPASGKGVVVSKWAGSVSQDQYRCGLWNNAGTRLFLCQYRGSVGGPSTRLEWPHSHTVNQWQHYAWTADLSKTPTSTEGKLYLDGVDQGTPTVGADNSVSSIQSGNGMFQMPIGFIASTGRDAWLDEVRVWNVERSAAQIAANYNAQIDPASTGLVAYWRMNNDAWVDQTANANHLTAGNHPTFGSSSLPFS